MLPALPRCFEGSFYLLVSALFRRSDCRRLAGASVEVAGGLFVGMESRRMSTRSSRRSTPLPVSPIKQAMMANVMQGAGKATAKRSSRKVLADKTNATPVAGLIPNESPRKAPIVAVAPQSKAEEETVSPHLKLRSLEPQPATPVVVRGEDLLRSLVHSNLSITETPNGLAKQSPEAETPQFGVPPVSPYQATAQELQGASADLEAEVVDARLPTEPLPESEVTSVSERLASAWVGRDVDDVTEVAEDDDSDCSVLVNVSSPGVNSMHLVASPAPATSIRPTTPQTADFKWQRRDQALKVKEQASESFNYYGWDDEYDDAEDFDGEVIDCEEICQDLSRMGVAEAAGLPEHKGRHIRFNYNSEDEIDVEEVDVMRLRGLPTPRGKHLRFPEDTEVSSA